MINKSTNYINLISILIIIYLAFIPLKPHDIRIGDIIGDRFFIENAAKHISSISKHPHYVGANQHRVVQNYIIKQLQNMGLEVRIQKTDITDSGQRKFIQVENIFTVIKGSNPNRKSLVVMSHYDSVPFDSLGTGDAATGVAIILEAIRGYLDTKVLPENDIVILFTDAEEIGLMGAKAFVKKNKLSKNIGAVLNFEARGTAGSSYMFLETNSGNHNLLQSFIKADIKIPNSNSMAYSIYKMLPNDTDLTVFREDANILGFNFAFIDNHFNYHTILDNPENLSLDSLAHHAGYLIPLLRKLSQDDLSLLNSDVDDVYFQIPFWKTVSYPFSWTLAISLINLLFFALAVFYGIKNKSLEIKSISRASIPLFKSMIITALLSFVILKFLYYLHPQYSEILQGFTYNGHRYVIFFSLMAFAICFIFYKNVQNTFSATTLMVVPLFIWILLSIAFALLLTGAHFFVIISLLGTLTLAIAIFTKKPQPNLILLLSLPVIIIFAPLFMQLPVALGIALLPFTGVLLVLILATFISSISIPDYFQINKWIIILPLIGTFTWAEMTASTSKDRPLPNSLFYFQDQESNEAFMFTADYQINDWNKEVFKNEVLDTEDLQEFRSNHWRRAKTVTQVENKNIKVAKIDVLKERKYVKNKLYELQLTTNRNIDVIYIRTKTDLNLFKFSVNGETISISDSNSSTQKYAENTRLVTIYPTQRSQFTLEFDIKPNEFLDLDIIEISHNLLTSKKFDIPERTEEFIPKPFIYSDSIITKLRFTR